MNCTRSRSAKPLDESFKFRSKGQQLLVELKTGIEIDSAEVEVGAGQLLTYKGEQVISYIKDTRASIWTIKNESENLKNFHIADCHRSWRTRHMKNAGVFERCVVTNQTDELFLVDWLNPDSNQIESTEVTLKVCWACLLIVNWRGYKSGQRNKKTKTSRKQFRESIWEEFSISEFFTLKETIYMWVTVIQDMSRLQLVSSL